MAKDTPTRDRSRSERGLTARHGDDPTLGSYLSSLLYLLSFPVFVLAAFGGYWLGWYGYGSVVPVLGGLFVGAIAVALVAMHFLTRGT